jgi:DNA-binding CsgD family transcriptional regulator
MHDSLPIWIRIGLIFVIAILGVALYLRSRTGKSAGYGEVQAPLGKLEIPPAIEAEWELIESTLQRLAGQGDLSEEERNAALVALQRLAYKLEGKPLEDAGNTPYSLQTLTPTEREVLVLIASGHSTEQIAQILGCSLSRVYKSRSALRKSLNVGKDADLQRFIQEAPK